MTDYMSMQAIEIEGFPRKRAEPSRFVYYSPRAGGHLGILTIYHDGFTAFEIDRQSGPVNGMPETWGGGWVRIGKL